MRFWLGIALTAHAQLLPLPFLTPILPSHTTSEAIASGNDLTPVRYRLICSDSATKVLLKQPGDQLVNVTTGQYDFSVLNI